MSSEPRPFLPYGRQTITEADIAAVVEVLRSPFITQGPAVPAFEQAVAAKVGARHGVAVNSATSALHLACLALGLGPGDRLWTSPITFVASANCGRYCGAAMAPCQRCWRMPAMRSVAATKVSRWAPAATAPSRCSASTR